MRSEDENVMIVQHLMAMEESGDFPGAPVRVGPYTAFVLIGALQLAWRHPDLSPDLKMTIEQIGREFQQLFSGTVAELVDAGWDTARDVPR